MAKKSKLLAALDAHKGRDFYMEKQKKMAKAAEKRKKQGGEGVKAEGAEDKVKGKSQEQSVKEKESLESASLDEAKQAKNEEDKKADDEEASSDEQEEEEENEEDEEEDESDIPLSDLEEDDMADVVPHQRLTINNSAAITAALKRISFTAPFSEHNSLISSTPLEVPDVHDDLQRELAFYTVCQAGAKEARRLLIKEGIPFSRPRDYFAEMVKTDEHMGKIKKQLFEEAAAKKASAEAKKQRELKKFGKQVQVAKLQQRQKEKREMMDKVNSLKRKRNAGGTTGPEDQSDLFDVALDNADKPGDRNRDRDRRKAGPNFKRQKKNEKFGFGGKKKYKKSNDAKSSADLGSFSASRMKGRGGKGGGAAKRPGKGRRAAMRS
ncbi:rRNA-processing protein and EBNA1-binding protein ebp2 [Ascosphaera acerosa]|nr:rRNA-processing protein and EBNA1-binding protein ebp2 [Ascosphaera acerosa]